MNNVKLTDFFSGSVRDANLYQNYRVIPGIDGLKNTQRKCLYVLQSSTKEDKVSNKAAQISTSTSYLHGDSSILSVLTNLNARFAGSGQNLCVLNSNGQYGNKMSPGAVGAPRYVYTDKTKLFDKMYRKEDIKVYEEQYFEGDKIEPKSLLPVLIPLCNTQYSIGSGFSSFILPRDPKKLVQYLNEALSGKTPNPALLTPFIKGWYGTVSQDTTNPNTFHFRGTYKKDNCNQLTITEIKPFCDLETYLKFLDKLVENKTIKSYKDLSSSTGFKFVLSVPAVFFTTNNTEDKICKALMLSESMTENLTFFDENGKLVVYPSIEEYVAKFIEWRKEKYLLRKEYILNQLKEEQEILTEKAKFIKLVVEGNLILTNRPKAEILKEMEIKCFVRREELLSLPLYNLTKEKYEELLRLVEKKRVEVENYEKETDISLWKKDLTELETEIDAYNLEWEKEYSNDQA